MFRATRRLLAAVPQTAAKETPSLRTKLSTGITGLAVHPEPLSALKHNYGSLLALLEQAPKASVYRQSAEAITRERLAVVERAGSEGTEAQIEQVEQQIGAGLVEELVDQSLDELKLAGKMLEWKAWEELEEAPAPGQWAPFRVTPSTTTADDLHPN
ncbi:hypothetical protein Rhopal_005173-T1 [Rhodotorula paludigena]|uniref:Uncharacterized protein n=1 Tax=Rhodotorula paludigena TaxID=86838 RepID=A0AAV5GPQ9_9BASI|nr:hypothetical protein Rhopal_005173-T1 [Rhodotorula paludigena]